MANAIEQKVDVSGALGGLRLTVEQRRDPAEGKKPHSENPFQLNGSMQLPRMRFEIQIQP